VLQKESLYMLGLVRRGIRWGERCIERQNRCDEKKDLGGERHRQKLVTRTTEVWILRQNPVSVFYLTAT
jgi:hypothetical protein